MGLIYLVTSPSGKQYIGQHNSDDLKERKRTHGYRYLEFLKKKCILELNKKFNPGKKFPNNPSGFCTSLYCAFQKYSFENFEWEVLQDEIEIEDLNNIEDQYIVEYNTLAPNGYNLKLNESPEGESAYSDETRARMSVSHTESRRIHLHKYRKKHAELEGVPQYVTYFNSGGIRGYRILRHPKCPFKQFADATTPVVELKKQMLEFLQECEDKPYETIQKRKLNKGIPKGISEQKPGRFIVQFRYKGVRYDKFFSMEPRELALKNAIKWMQNKKLELNKE